MLELLYSVIATEMVVILLVIFRTPVRKAVILGLDKLKRGRGPVMVRTIAVTILLLLVFTVNSVVKIQSRASESGGPGLGPTDQVLVATHLLEASLMGFMLFLSLMIDRLHHYIRELRLLRKTMEATKKQNRSSSTDDLRSDEELKALSRNAAALKAEIEKLESKCEAKSKEAKAAEAETEARKKQSEGFLIEYDHLVEENQSLRSQLDSIAQNVSRPENKKSM